MQDYILRATAYDGRIRAFFATTRGTVNEAASIHRTTPVMSAALGRLLTAGAIMGLNLKNDDDRITLQIKGDGPGGGVLVTADRQGHVKGYPHNPQVVIPKKPNGKLDVGGALGHGTLTVIMDMGFGDPYVGNVPLQSGEVAEDIAYYYAQSEQTPSVVSLGVLVDRDYSIKQAGGFVIQLLPGATEEVIRYLEGKMEGLPSITNLYEEGHTPESLARLLFEDCGYHELERIPVSFYCNCSKARVEKALITLGREEITKLLEEDGGAQLQCHFCNKSYDFTADDLRRLLERTPSET